MPFLCQQTPSLCNTCLDVCVQLSHAQKTFYHYLNQGCQVVTSKKGQINPQKSQIAPKKAKYKINTQRHLQNTKTRFQKVIYTYFIHKKNKATAHSLENLSKLWFCWGVAWIETANLKTCNKQNKKLEILVQNFQWKFIILCPETVSRNMPKSSLNLPNRHKKSNSPK